MKGLAELRFLPSALTSYARYSRRCEELMACLYQLGLDDEAIAVEVQAARRKAQTSLNDFVSVLGARVREISASRR
jgi:hypothetical protein